jgi:hypothetical protein
LLKRPTQEEEICGLLYFWGRAEEDMAQVGFNGGLLAEEQGTDGYEWSNRRNV